MRLEQRRPAVLVVPRAAFVMGHFRGCTVVVLQSRNGNTVGTLVCQDFQCSRNVRKLPPPAYEGYDVEAARLRRIEDLQVRAASFAAEV